MKRKLSILLAAAAVAVLIAFVLQPDPSIGWAAFQPRLRDTLQRNGYVISSESSCSPQQVPLPFAVSLHPYSWRAGGSSQLILGFPDGAERYTVSRGGSSTFDCLVRYLHGRACCLRIRSHSATPSTVAEFRSILTEQFPGLPVASTP